jgi:hypothetical protein
MRSAVLFLVFNRPNTTRRVFEAIRAARPPRLYVAADGPRANRPGEAERCAEARHIAMAVDWPCEVKSLFRDQNLGCKMGVSGGISWFFDSEEEGIILEDDVLPLPSFFAYCDELLERYRCDQRVAMISGSNLISSHFTPKESYFFSRYAVIWGWACWRRTWQQYDVAMKLWPAWRDRGGLTAHSGGNRLFEAYWCDTFDAVYRGEIDTWDYQLVFTCSRLGSLIAVPAQNQTHNLGFGPDATHTTPGSPDYVVESIPQPLDFPLVHPVDVERHEDADAVIDSKICGITRLNAIRRWIRAIPGLGFVLIKAKNLLKYALH